MDVLSWAGSRVWEGRIGFGRAVTIGMRGFGWESVWKGGWFWVEVEGLVFIVNRKGSVGWSGYWFEVGFIERVS